MLIGEVARQSGISARTIRFYEASGVIAPATRSSAGYRLYGEHVLEELRFVQQSQRLGFSLADVQELVTIHRAGRTPCEGVAALCERHLGEIDARIAELKRYQRDLKATRDRAQARCGMTPGGFCSAVMEPAPLRIRAKRAKS